MPPEMTCWIMLIFMSLINVHLLYIWNSIPASKINPASPHCYKTPTQLRNSSKCHVHASIQDSLQKAFLFLRARGCPAAPHLRLHGVGNIHHQFVVPHQNASTAVKREHFFSETGCQYRIEQGRHAPGHLNNHSNRRQCLLCNKGCVTFCIKCQVPLCLNLKPGASHTNCYARFHMQELPETVNHVPRPRCRRVPADTESDDGESSPSSVGAG